MKNKIWLNKSFILYLLGQVISSLGDGFYMVSFMWLTLEASGGKGIVLGGVLSVYTMGEIIFGFIAGPIVDRINRKSILIIVDILRGCIVFLLYLLVITKEVKVLYLYAITFAFAIVSPFFHRAEFAVIPQLVEKTSLLSANGILSGSKRLMQVISPALGGIFIGFFGLASCFLFDAVSFFFSSLCILFISIKPIEIDKKKFNLNLLISDFRHGFRFLISSTFLLTLTIYACCINFFGGPVFPMLPLVSQQAGTGSSGYGSMMSGLSAGFIISSLLISVVGKLINRISLILLGLIISSFSIMLMGFALNIVYLVGAAVILGIGLNFSNLPILTLFQEKVPQDKIGVVSSFVFTIAQVAMPISIALSGILVDVFSLKGIFVAITIILFIGALIGFALPQLREGSAQNT